ncbi:MAG: carboxypeptidase-like regulatory domain-containing protein [Terracidiphilus sp.]|jgi:hypothetical protein
MKSMQFALPTFAVSLLLTGALVQAATIAGTVTNKTTGKPAVGDKVVLVNPMASMAETAQTTTDAKGHYSLQSQGNGPALVRVLHQGAEYFIAAPQGSAPGDLSVYDVAAKVQGVFIEADVVELESDNGQLKVTERYFVHNTSSPPTTQWSARSFEVNLPPDAVIDGVGGQRPNGIPTSIKLDPAGPKGHYAFNFPIQPDDGDKDTLFQLGYHLPYSGGKYTFKAELTLPADNFAVLMPKGMSFTPGAGTTFKPVQEDPGVQTYLVKNAAPGKPMEFTIAGTGSMPREQQGAAAAGPAGGPAGGAGMGAADGNSPSPDASSATPTGPGGGIGTPINTPDPLSKYKWWILGGLGLLLVAGAAFLLRKPVGSPAPGAVVDAGAASYLAFGSPAAKNNQLLGVLKEELFAIESEKISGTITPAEYAEVKAALETVLRRALKRNS